MATPGYARSLALLALLLTAGVLGDWPLQAQSRRSSSVPIPPAATAQARARGSVRVIIGLDVAAAPESSLALSAVQSQRASIARAQDAVLSRVARAKRSAVRRFNYIPFMAMEVDEADLQALAASQDVRDIQIDAVARPTLAKSTPLVGAVKAWAAGYTGAGWTVALLDTGVDASHPFLAGKVVSEACYSSTVADRSSTMCPSGSDTSTLRGAGGPCLLPGCGHGTHVAGIAAGKGTEFSGVAPDANIISVQVFSSFSSDDCETLPRPCLLSYTSDQILGLERVYALRSAYNIASVNMSLGGGLYTQPCDFNSMKAIIDELRAAGIATVIASGNNGSTTALSDPACISTAISVASTTSGTTRPADEVSVWSNTNQYLSLLAPGEPIFSSLPGGAFGFMSGTSMAAPHVAGAWALMKSKRPSASVTEILDALVATSTRVTDQGNGLVLPRISVDAALSAISACDYAVSPSQINVGPQAGTVSVAITTSPTCAWWTTTASSFVAVPGSQSSGTGPGHVLLSYSANQSHWARDGHVTIAGTTVTISQRTTLAVAGDVSGDGRADMLWQNIADGSLAAWWLDGSRVVGTSPISIDKVRDTKWRVVGTGDLNGDGSADLVWRHETEGWLAVWYLSGSQVFGTEYLSINRVPDTDWCIRGVGDVDGDGKADLVWQHATQGWVAVWLMNGTQVVSTRMLSLDRVADLQWQITGAGDVDGDGKADLIWQHQTDGWLAVWFMNGSEVLDTRFLSIERILDPSWHIRGVGDVDGNGRADLLWQNDATAALGVWLLNGSIVIGQQSLSIDRVDDLNWRVVGPG